MSVDSHSYELLSREERRAYDADLKAYRDIKNQFAYARQQGYARGFARSFIESYTEFLADHFSEEGETYEESLARGRKKAAKLAAVHLKSKNIPVEFIVSETGLTREEIKGLPTVKTEETD